MNLLRRQGPLPGIVVFLLVAAAGCAELTGLPDVSYRGEGRILTPTPRGSSDPVVSGTDVVWRAGRDGELRHYDLRADTARVLLDAGEGLSGYALHAGRVVWAMNPRLESGALPALSRLEMLDLETGRRRTVVQDSARIESPSLSGARLVWQGGRHRAAEIYLMELESGEVRTLTENDTWDHDPVVWQDRVAWVSGQSGRVHLLDLSAERHVVLEESVVTGGPDLANGHLVWEDHRGPSPDVYHYEVDTGRERRLGLARDVAPFGSDQTEPRVGDDAVVWRDDRWGIPDIYLYDLAADEERPLDTGEGRQRTDPDVADGTIVWIGQDPVGSIYLYALALD